MKQAIEEGFILDVLANYTTYKSYYEIQKSIDDNPLFDTKKAQKKLRAYVERSQQTIDTKAEIMLDHFIPQVVTAKKLKGKAKGMVVTQNIETAIRYYQAITRCWHEQGNPFKALIAFSGRKDRRWRRIHRSRHQWLSRKRHRGQIRHRRIPAAGGGQQISDRFRPAQAVRHVRGQEAAVRVGCAGPVPPQPFCAQAGQDEPKTCSSSISSTASTTSRRPSTRSTPSTTLSEATDVNVLHELKDALDEVGVYEWQEVEDFVTRYFADEDAQTLSPIIDIAADRFNHELELTMTPRRSTSRSRPSSS